MIVGLRSFLLDCHILLSCVCVIHGDLAEKSVEAKKMVHYFCFFWATKLYSVLVVPLDCFFSCMVKKTKPH